MKTGASSKKIQNMTEGKPMRIITMFALPMILSNLFQQLYNVIDSLIVGNFLGTNALASVGSTGSITAVLVQLSTGLALGGSVVISQYFGAKRKDRIRLAATTMSIFISVLAVLVTAVMFVFAEPILVLIQTPEDILADSASYLKIYVLGCLPIFLYNAINGVYVALGNSKTPLYFLLVSSITNVVLDLLFILVFPMGVAGAALATVISQIVAAVLAVLDVPKLLTEFGRPQTGPQYFDRALLITMLKYALPAALQQSIVSVGTVIVQATINTFGAVVIAGTAAAAKIVNLASSVAINFSNAYSNYVGQNIGAGKQERITPGLLASIWCCGAISLAMTVILELFAEEMIRMFVNDGNIGEVVRVGAEYVRVVGAFMIVFSVFMLLKATFKGSGDMKWFIITTLSSFFIRLGLTVGLAHVAGVSVIWWSICIGWVLSMFLATGRYLQGGWREKSVLGK